MKRSILLVITAMIYLLYTRPLYSSDEDSKDWALTLYPAMSVYSAIMTADLFKETQSAVIGFSGEIEYRLNDYFSIPLEIRYLHMQGLDFMINIIDAGPGIRLYPAGEGMKGFFIAHHVQFMYGRFEGYDDTDDFKATQYIGLPEYYISTSWIGYRWLFDYFHFELSFGFLGFYPIKDKELESVFMPGSIGIGFGTMF